MVLLQRKKSLFFTESPYFCTYWWSRSLSLHFLWGTGAAGCTRTLTFPHVLGHRWQPVTLLWREILLSILSERCLFFILGVTIDVDLTLLIRAAEFRQGPTSLGCGVKVGDTVALIRSAAAIGCRYNGLQPALDPSFCGKTVACQTQHLTLGRAALAGRRWAWW